MKYLPAILFATVVASFSFSHCRKDARIAPTLFDSLQKMNGDYAMEGMRTGYTTGQDWSAGGVWITKTVNDTIRAALSIIFVNKDTAIVAFSSGNCCNSSGEYSMTNIEPAAQKATYKRFGWKESIDVWYGKREIKYSGGQNGIHENFTDQLSSR